MKVKFDSHSQLPQSKILLLESILTNRTIGAYNAQAILSAYYGYNFPLIVETASGLEYREKAEDKKEMQMLSKFNHPNIVLYKHHFLQKFLLYIVMEYCPLGSLRELKYKENIPSDFVWKCLSELTKCFIFKQQIYHVLLGLHFRQFKNTGCL